MVDVASEWIEEPWGVIVNTPSNNFIAYSIMVGYTEEPLTHPTLLPRRGEANREVDNRQSLQLRQLFCLIFILQWLDHIVQITIHHHIEFVNRQVDAMISQSTLRKIVGTNSFGAIA